MAKDDDDKYKEGVDFEWVQGNDDENSGFKTRRFFTKAEKKARNAPKVEAPKAAAPKAKLKGITTPKITTTKLDQSVRPEGKPSGMPMDSTKKAIKNYTDQLNSGKLTDSEARSARTAITRLGGTYKTDALRAQAADQTERSRFSQGMKELMTGRKGAAAQYKEGGVVKMKKGGTPLSSTELKKLNLSTGIKKVDERDAKFATYADRGTSGRDAGLKEAAPRLSSLRSTYKRSKDMIERYGTDAPKARGFMAYEGQSGTTKKKSGGVVKKAGGGTMRGTGAAVRGKRFTGSR
jgi:hypothetical protein